MVNCMLKDQWIKNKQMKILFEKLEKCQDNNLMTINMENLFLLFNPSLKKVCDCILITNEDPEQIEKNFANAIKMHMDRTGYEASSTETRINDFFSTKISVLDGIRVSMLVVNIWKLKIKSLDPSCSICFILSVNEEYVELRCHKVRKSEGLWVDTDLNNYTDGAIAYTII